MAWFIIVIWAYFFGAISNIGDKFLLGSKRISSAPVYAFYIGLFGLGALILAPFGLTFPQTAILFLCFAGGILFLTGILLLYFAIEKAEASRVIPVVGAIVPISSFLLAAAFSLEKLTQMEIAGAIILVFGGLLISFDLPIKLGKKKFFSGFYFACASGFILAAAYLIFKQISGQTNFITWYIWTRIGGILGVVLLLLVPNWRKKIFRSFHAHKENKRQAIVTAGIFVGNKIFGGISTLLLNYAIGLSSITLINSLVSIQYVFVLFIVALLSMTHAHVFREKLLFWDWAQKVVAIAIIAAGMFLIY
jgi:hypothetical protein